MNVLMNVLEELA